MVSSASTPRSLTITCAHCDLTQAIPLLPARGIAECGRCHRRLHRAGRPGIELPLAAATAQFILLPPAVFLPLMDSTIRNLVFEQSRLVSSVPVIYQEVWFPFAFGFLFFAVLFPALCAFFQVVVLASLRWNLRLRQVGRLFRWAEELRVWSMTDVVVIAGVVAYYRASVPADVVVRVGAFSYIAVAALAIVADRTLDRRRIWNAIYPDLAGTPAHRASSCDVCELASESRRPGDLCPRCGSTLDPNIVVRFGPAAAAVAAAIPLCLPAYAASVMVNDQLTAVLEHTVVGTIQLLADHGYWQISVVILFCGIVIPIATLLALIWLLASVRFPARRGLVLRTRAYRLFRRLVRWPMVIPFIAAIAAPIVDFRGIDDIVAGPGATPLFGVIVLLMIAMRLFEPKFMWKTAGVA